jgi:hypothetical protein
MLGMWWRVGEGWTVSLSAGGVDGQSEELGEEEGGGPSCSAAGTELITLAYRRNVYPMSGNLMFFEKINEDDCLFMYGFSYSESKLDAEPLQNPPDLRALILHL